MAVILGKSAVLKVSTTIGGAYTTVAPLDTIELEKGYESADIAAFGDAAAHKTPSLQVFSGSCSGKRDRADAGQVIVDAALTNATVLCVQILEDGTNGWKAECVLSPKKQSAKQGPDAETFGFSFEISGGVAPTAVP